MLLVDAVADIDTLFALDFFAGTTAGDSTQGVIRADDERVLGHVSGLFLLGHPLVPEVLRRPRGGGIRVGPALGRSNAIPCCVGGCGRGHLLLVDGEFVMLVMHAAVLREDFGM
ncbi:hypothetical protein M271_24135 [Streptomyces rapamycinicus NRRL 5491]|nr:hypothetical protein M271_24135 [Streptomyces rapamycinicus NRRL 5491]